VKYSFLLAIIFAIQIVLGADPAGSSVLVNGDSINVTVAQARGAVYMCRHAMPMTLAIQNISQNDVEIFSQQPDFPGLTFAVDPNIRSALGVLNGTAMTTPADGIMPSVIIKPSTTVMFHVYLDRYLVFPLPSSDVFAIKWRLALSLNGRTTAIKEGIFTAQIFDEKEDLGNAALERYLNEFQRASVDDDIFGLYGTTSDLCIPFLGRIQEGPFKTMAIQALEHHTLTPIAIEQLQKSIDGRNASEIATALNVLAHHRVLLDEMRIDRLLIHKDEMIFQAFANYAIRMSKLLNIQRLVGISKGSDPKDQRRAIIAREALKEIFVSPIPQEGADLKSPGADPAPPNVESANGF
jgi:hypothetical protein